MVFSEFLKINFWFLVNQSGVVFILECTEEDETVKIMNELPEVITGLMDVKIIPLEPILPLGALIGRKLMV
tara:strand:+ start:7246 stop:7458 length:213 start_codon:yes stop_codon:yes gene_type:complete